MRRSSVPKLRNMVDQFIRTIGSDIVPVSVRTGAPIRTWRPPPLDGDVFGRGDVLEAVGAAIPRQPPEGRPRRVIVDAERNMARPVRAARSTVSLCPEPPRRRPRTLRLMAEEKMASPPKRSLWMARSSERAADWHHSGEAPKVHLGLLQIRDHSRTSEGKLTGDTLGLIDGHDASRRHVEHVTLNALAIK